MRAPTTNEVLLQVVQSMVENERKHAETVAAIAQTSDRHRMADVRGVASISELEQVARRAVQLYAESRPRPSQVTMIQAGEMLGLSPYTVSKMVRAGQMKLNRCGLISIHQVDAMLKLP